jgi:hypothetical protein
LKIFCDCAKISKRYFMAKKFYYQGKNKSANKQGEDKAQAQPQNLDEKAQVKAQKSDKPQGQPQKSDKPQGQPQKSDNKSQRHKGDNRGQNQPKHHKAQPPDASQTCSAHCVT